MKDGISANDLAVIIISGLSGSGKSIAIRCFEDMGYFCVDNLPPPLLPVFVDLCCQSMSEIKNVAVGMDIRERVFLGDFFQNFKKLKEEGYRVKLIFLEAEDSVLLRRFSETRRPHPLAKTVSVLDGIRIEREHLGDLRKEADKIIDTTDCSPQQLKELLIGEYLDKAEQNAIKISVVSFGYRYGTPSEVDLLFDVRFISNPNFVPSLRPLTGQDPEVISYILKQSEVTTFLERVKNLLDFLIPQYQKEGRAYLTIAIGCTGGRHRSIAIGEILDAYLKSKGHDSSIKHRDINR
jgi:UPF0042 nucleotide-binding protein